MINDTSQRNVATSFSCRPNGKFDHRPTLLQIYC